MTAADVMKCTAVLDESFVVACVAVGVPQEVAAKWARCAAGGIGAAAARTRTGSPLGTIVPMWSIGPSWPLCHGAPS
ncbi:hypothetical protein [Streptomyces goshikiensis]|uniref:hypothetical protein n=1 Tax=Streptomyces goshikiensis TaxID=1942 RepID=UPI003326EBB7